MTRDFLSTYKTPTLSGPSVKGPLLCSSCGVVFGLSSMVEDKAIINCHHCGCRNEIHVEEQRDNYTGESIRKVKVTQTEQPPVTPIDKPVQEI